MKYHREEDGRRVISEQGFSRKWKKMGGRWQNERRAKPRIKMLQTGLPWWLSG